jgi:hypothetical protein
MTNISGNVLFVNIITIKLFKSQITGATGDFSWEKFSASMLNDEAAGR